MVESHNRWTDERGPVRAPYTLPAKSPKDPLSGRLGRADWYIKLPASLWTSGLFSVVSGTGLALLLVLMELGADTQRHWLAPSQARLRYELSEDAWTKGTRELSQLGALRIGRKALTEKEFGGWLRFRNTYRLDLSLPAPVIPTREHLAGPTELGRSRKDLLVGFTYRSFPRQAPSEAAADIAPGAQ